ncbi:MAG TPA: winged helix-turn-helix domain-containing protein [Mesotoga sp.]|nr:winged helix-turn-helix transcriptional regulator [Mesotoga sp.]HPI17030.1 winged helix-turn-helix domain-containing protein [Mesotoga sp.]HQC57088.1 winged helix-turn-helix domain-containing protein [Mesotoga sp.]HQQ55889.1 winged helix-turn-helix domain-containing protein [Mesotoga sp.]
MKTIDRVETRKGRIYDFLPGIYRLTNNERLVEHFKELTPGYRPVGEIAEWVRITLKKLPESILEKMDLYFNWQTPLAMRLSPIISENGLKTVDEFLKALRAVPPEDLLRDFLLIGLGPRAVGFDESIISQMLGDQQKALVFLAKKAVLTPHQKAVMLDFFSNPVSMKDDFVHLLEWYAEHIFPTISYDEGAMEESERDLIKNLQSRGEEYLLKLIDNMRYDELEDGRKILLAISYFVENAQGGVFHPRARNDLFVVGYRFVNSVLEDDPLRQAAARYRAMGEPRRIKLLRMLFGKRYTGYDISRKLKMSNAEVTETFSNLVACNLIKTYRTQEGVYFTADRDEVIDLLIGQLSEND